MVEVKQSKLPATDTDITMANYYDDATVSSLEDVTRSIQNRTQFARLSLTRAQATFAGRGDSLVPSGVLTDTPHYIDGLFTANPTAGASLMVIGFNPRQVSTTTIDIFSTLTMSTTTSKWQVSTSLTNLPGEFDNPIFDAAIAPPVVQGVDTPTGQFKTTLTVGAPTIDTSGNGLPFWRITHEDLGAFNSVTEVQILAPLDPKITYFNTSGSSGSIFPFDQPNILDACWDPNNNSSLGQFFTIRFNDDLIGTSTVTLDDNFSDADAGTASGTNTFNTARWTESTTNTRFLRLSDELSYIASTGKGQLETTYTFTGDFDVEISTSPASLTSDNMWFVMQALDVDNKAIISEGVGIETSPTLSGSFFSSYLDNFIDATSNSTVSNLRFLWHNTANGTDSFTLVSDGGTSWTVSGTQTGALADATTGIFYDEATAPTTPLEFIVSSPTAPAAGEQFTFNIVTSDVNKGITATGTIGISRSGNNLTTDNVVTVPVDLGTPAEVSIELFGNTDGSISINADDYTITAGSATFSDVAVFTVERTDSEGNLLSSNPTVIESFDIIGDPSLTYNDFLDGRVQIACSSSGSSTAGFIYIKVDDVLYKYANNISQATGAGEIATSTAQISKDGTSSLQWSRESGLDFTAPAPFLSYLEYDVGSDVLHLKTVDPDSLNDNTDTREVLLDISDYSTNAYGVFYDQNDFDTLYYVDSSKKLQAFNLDDRISAFMAVNALDITLPAGTAQDTTVNADVINAWGEALNGKTVTFSVAGDGATTPSSSITTGAGRATTTFTVGATVGVSTVTATVTETG